MKNDPKLPWPLHLQGLEPDHHLVEKIEKILSHYSEGTDGFPFEIIAPTIARAVQFEWLPNVDLSSVAEPVEQTS